MASPTPLLSRAQRGSFPLADVTVRLHPDDDVVIAKQALLARTTLTSDSGAITIAQMIPPGHKVAVQPIAEGSPVHRYGQIIGFATQDIAPGQHVHSHNIAVHQGELNWITPSVKAMCPWNTCRSQSGVHSSGTGGQMDGWAPGTSLPSWPP